MNTSASDRDDIAVDVSIPNRIRSILKRRGFTFVELMVVLAVLSLVQLNTLPDIETAGLQTTVERAADVTFALIEAIYARCGAEHDGTECFASATPYSVGALQTAGYLPSNYDADGDGREDIDLPSGNVPDYFFRSLFHSPSTADSHGFQVTKPTTARALRIEFFVPDQQMAHLVASSLPSARAIQTSGGRAKVRVLIVPPAMMSTLTAMLPRDGSQPMTGNLWFDFTATRGIYDAGIFSACPDFTVGVSSIATHCDDSSGNPRVMEFGSAISGLGYNSAGNVVSEELEVYSDLGVNGHVFVGGNVNAQSVLAQSFLYLSDEREKQDIEPLALDQIDKLQLLEPVKYKMKKQEARTPDREHYGLLAQDVEKVYPNMVGTDDSGMKYINYQALVPLLLANSSRLADRIEELEHRLEDAN